MADDDTISLRPIALRPGGPGGANPFAQFGKGSGFGIKSKKATVVSAGADDRAPKKDGVRITYSKAFLMEFMERFNKCPVELQSLNAEFVIQEQSERDQQRAALLKVAEEIDDRDWRTRDEAPAPASKDQRLSSNNAAPAADKAAPAADTAKPAPAGAGVQKPKQPAAAPPAAPPTGEIVRAADMGREAYRPGAQVSAYERSVRAIKGVLNKLTPEKFDRLLQQLLEVITTAELLQQTITLVFENAVEQPTYCAMYADLCLQLSKELPTFPPPDLTSKPVSFHQILLNTCQDEFEGTEEARVQLQSITDEHARGAAERAVKKRTLGNMRLMSELYKQDMVKDWIMCTCIDALLEKEKEKGKTLPTEDNIEAACEMIGTAGSKLSKSENAQTRAKLEDFFKLLLKYESDKGLAPRVRFLIKDLVDLRKSNWVARREVFTAKKLEEVRAQAEAELGMVSSNITAYLPTLPAQQRMSAVEDFDLIPMSIRGGGGGTEAWMYKPTAPGAAQKTFTGSSALLGDYQPLVAAAPAPDASSSAPAGAATSEDLQRKTESLFAEYTSTLDKAEACTCVQELGAPDFMTRLVEIGLEAIMNAMKDKDAEALEVLLLHLQTQGLVQQVDVLSAMNTYTSQLEDLSLDVPKAPSLLGHYIGSAMAQKLVPGLALPELLAGDYSAEPKRALAEAAFSSIKEKLGEAGLGELCTSAGMKTSTFLEADPEFDAHLPPLKEWLDSLGLGSVVPI